MKPSPIEVVVNPRYRADQATGEFPVAEAEAEITSWPGYAPTRLVWLGGLAAHLGVAAIAYKDEAERFGLGSFKALGGAYAVRKILQKAGTGADTLTVTTATDGNHGRSVAWGAERFGAKAVIFVPVGCSAGRVDAIAAYGAEVVRVDGDYDHAVETCSRTAEENGWIVVADTTASADETIPAMVTLGYSVMINEALNRFGASGPPSHVFVQAGVGALAAAVCETLRTRGLPVSPRVVVVEPRGAACLFRSVQSGTASRANGPVHSVMAGLDCGQTSPLAWRVLDRAAHSFAIIEDEAVAPAMRLLAESPHGDPPIVAGESAVAGLIALVSAMADGAARDALGLARDSRVLLLGTEGATDPEIYRRMVANPAR